MDTMNTDEEETYTCPSFSSYSSNRLSEIARKVAAEDEFQFEFSLAREDKEISAEKFSHDSQIGPIFPVFNRDVISTNDELITSGKNGMKITLNTLLMQNRNDAVSCSSSEADELENVPAGTYCVWRPKLVETTPLSIVCKKSSSTGSASKRWKLPDFLRRSNSEGKGAFVFLTPKNREEKLETIEMSKKVKRRVGSSSGGGACVSPSAHEALYVHNRAVKEGEKRKSYLPYRRDLVGFFATVDGLGKSLPRF